MAGGNMLVVAGTLTVAPAERAAFIEQRADLMRRARSEPGCLAYAISADPIDPDTIRLFECWASQADLDAHVAALRAARAQPQPEPALAPLTTSIRVYPIADEGPRPL
jgi:quinol monooxygenase YgiN